jgi:hypothetical protein
VWMEEHMIKHGLVSEASAPSSPPPVPRTHENAKWLEQHMIKNGLHMADTNGAAEAEAAPPLAEARAAPPLAEPKAAPPLAEPKAPRRGLFKAQKHYQGENDCAAYQLRLIEKEYEESSSGDTMDTLMRQHFGNTQADKREMVTYFIPRMVELSVMGSMGYSEEFRLQRITALALFAAGAKRYAETTKDETMAKDAIKLMADIEALKSNHLVIDQLQYATTEAVETAEANAVENRAFTEAMEKRVVDARARMLEGHISIKECDENERWLRLEYKQEARDRYDGQMGMRNLDTSDHLTDWIPRLHRAKWV